MISYNLLYADLIIVDLFVDAPVVHETDGDRPRCRRTTSEFDEVASPH